MPFLYKNHRLVLEQVGSVVDFSPWTKANGSPVYVYDLDGMLERAQEFSRAFTKTADIHYAMKANANSVLLKTFARQGLGVDVVSGGELSVAIRSGFKPEKIVFSGVGKTQSEIEQAVGLEIRQINVESPQELERVAQVAKRQKRVARVAFRMNPDVNPVTHPYIRTGFRENKFGMDASHMPELKDILRNHANSLELVGLTLHIGSQIRTLEPLFEAVEKILPIYNSLLAEGLPLTTLDVGGGLGINYEKPNSSEEVGRIREYAKGLEQLTKGVPARLLCEPGRILVAPFGLLLAEVQYIKSNPYKNFVILNTGMNHLLRPALYQAYHRILPVVESQERSSNKKVYDVVGPICESADVLGFERLLPEIRQGDWLAVAEVGAYGYVMSSEYNGYERPQEIVISKGQVV